MNIPQSVQPPVQPAKSSNRRLLIIVVGGILGLCVICGILAEINSILHPTAPSPILSSVDATLTAFDSSITSVAATYSVGSTQAAPTVNAISTQISAAFTQPAAATAVPLPTSAPAQGVSRDNPYPAGAAVDIGSNLLLSVGPVMRPANKNVQQYNMFNPTPDAGLEYMQVQLSAKCTKATSDTCSMIIISFKAVGADGQVHDPAFIAGASSPLDTTSEFFGGSTKKGNLIFLAPKGDKSVVLIVEPFLAPYIYIALP